MLSFGVLIAFWSPKQSEIEESSLESKSKSRIQGVWDPAHSTRTGIIAHSTRVGIPSGCRHFPPRMYHIRNSTAAAIPPGCITSRILLRRHSTRMFHIRNFDAGWERRAFQLSRSHISRSSDSAYPESFADILHSVAVFSWSFQIFATDIWRYFALDIWCWNPQTLLVTVIGFLSY